MKMKHLVIAKILVLAIYCALKIVAWANDLAAAQWTAPFARADRPALSAPFALPIARAGGDNVNSDTPQFTFGPIGTTYETRYRNLRAVDFANLTYRSRGIAPDLSIPLRNGAYDARDGVGFERAELRDVRVCDNMALTAPRAVVRLRYASGAGSSTCDEIVQVFDVRDGRLAARHEIVHACAPGGTYAVDCRRGTITATATAWLGGDPHCCPSARDTAVFWFRKESLRLLTWTRVALRRPTNPVK